MVAYLAATWTAAPPAVVDLLCEAIENAEGWRLAADQPGCLIALRGPGWPSLRALPSRRGWVIGDLYRQSFRSAVGEEVESVVISQRLSAEAVAEDLCQTYWGRYVALIIDRPSGDVSVFRDPSGAVEAMAWTAGGLGLVSSHLPDWLPDGATPSLTINWPVVRGWTTAPNTVATAAGLTGLSSVTPGAWRSVGGAERQVWRPAAFARSSGRAARAPMGQLPALLDACLSALLGDSSKVLAEVSGGLDSAIVAASLTAACPAKVVQWLNFHAADGQGDERSYAAEVAALGGFELTEAIKPSFAVAAELLEAVAGGVRPGVSGLDGLRDREIARRVAELGAERVVTGQGGDMVFFQIPTPVVAGDHLRARGPLGLVSPYLLDVSRWTRASIWRTLAIGLDRRAAWPGEASVRGHPWMAGAEDLPPGKRAQIAVLAQKLPLHVENVRARAAEIIHPLLAQPIVEACLAIGVPDLTRGGRDRALAREVFAERLPASVRERRGKGDLTSYYGRTIASSLEFLRPYLLDGRLVAEGVLDRRRLEAMLTREQLIWRGDYAAIMQAATIEAWVRHWEARQGRRAQAP